MSTTETEVDVSRIVGEFRPAMPIDLIDYSKTNPRKFMDKVKLDELAKSITQHGVIEPIVVRPHPKLKGRFELVAGERRHRAARIANCVTLPVIVRHYTDQQAAEVQQIENLQRADIHPLDEAFGFQRLIGEFKYTPESIGEKIGKTASYVLRRMTLVKLKTSLQEAMWKDKLSLGHAEYLCRLSDYDQTYLEKQLWQPYNDHALVSLRRIREEAERQLFMDLDRAPWKQTDDFVRGTPTCKLCPKRSGCTPLLFPEYEKQPNVCTDRECFDMKMDAYIDTKLIQDSKLVLISVEWQAKKEKGVMPARSYRVLDKKTDTCDLEKRGIFTDGGRAGHPARICIDKKCKKHGQEIHRTAGSAYDGKTSEAASKQAREWRIEAASLNAMFLEAWKTPAAKLKGFSMEDMKRLAHYAWDRAYARDRVAKAIGWERTKNKGGGFGSFHPVADQFIRIANLPELVKFIMLMVCNGDIDSNGYKRGDKDLVAVAKQWGMDVQKARTKARAELEAKYQKRAANKGKKK